MFVKTQSILAMGFSLLVWDTCTSKDTEHKTQNMEWKSLNETNFVIQVFFLFWKISVRKESRCSNFCWFFVFSHLQLNRKNKIPLSVGFRFVIDTVFRMWLELNFVAFNFYSPKNWYSYGLYLSHLVFQYL